MNQAAQRAEILCKQLISTTGIFSTPEFMYTTPYLDLHETYIPKEKIQEIVDFLDIHDGFISINPEKGSASICLFFKS